jgi:hypothetical protein
MGRVVKVSVSAAIVGLLGCAAMQCCLGFIRFVFQGDPEMMQYGVYGIQDIIIDTGFKC